MCVGSPADIRKAPDLDLVKEFLMNFGTQKSKSPVWLDMDQTQLDEAYDQLKFAPNRDEIVRRYASNSEEARRRLGVPKRLSYGASPIEGVDLYATDKANAPVNIFVHGGAWRSGSARDNAFAAELFVRSGVHYLVADFANVLDTGGDLMLVSRQLRDAVAWAYNNASTFGGDRNRIYISGHSSGAHLASVVMVTDWDHDFGLPKDIVKGGVLCSGMFDLRPVRLSSRGKDIRFTDVVEHALSSQRHLNKLHAPIVVAYGTLETPEFQRQSRDFAAAAEALGSPARLLVAEGYNHFEIAETLANPYGLLGRAVLHQMNLTAD
jgi:arylformamidase